MVTGIAVILWMPVLLWQTLALQVTWCLFSASELYRTWRCYKSASAYLVYADGTVDILAYDGSRKSGVYASGSIAGRRIAWLRVRRADGRMVSEFIARKTQESEEWRRFQVICRHVPAC